MSQHFTMPGAKFWKCTHCKVEFTRSTRAYPCHDCQNSICRACEEENYIRHEAMT